MLLPLVERLVLLLRVEDFLLVVGEKGAVILSVWIASDFLLFHREAHHLHLLHEIQGEAAGLGELKRGLDELVVVEVGDLALAVESLSLLGPFLHIIKYNKLNLFISYIFMHLIKRGWGS